MKMKLFITFLALLIANINCVMSTPPKRCLSSEACWPKAKEWETLNMQVHGNLVHVQSFLEPCKNDAKSLQCKATLIHARNPFFLETRPGATQSTGYLNAWISTPSQYAIAAKSSDDIVAGVNFARKHNLRLVIKGTGHDYLGRSNAPDSLLIWTHKMRDIKIHDSFVGQGCAASTIGVPAVTVGAGTRWLEVYDEVVNKHGRYVQGGGCTSVGAAGGFSQGGGFGSFSKKYGSGAANILEAEIVTADGKVLIANACQNKDLFWALRGGGGGTFGVVTKITYRTHDLPKTFGILEGQITASSDQAFKRLLEQFIHFYRENLNNEHWGEQVHVGGDNTLSLALVFQGLNQEEVELLWQPLKDWLAKKPDLFKIEFKITVIPAQKLWNYSYIQKSLEQNDPNTIYKVKKEDQSSYWWWDGDGEQVSKYWYSYLSRWIPVRLIQADAARELAHILFNASRNWRVELHINKGQAGASSEALRLSKETSINPVIYNAPMLVILGAGESFSFPGVKNHEPDLIKGAKDAKRVEAAMQLIRDATPETGTYVNEADYFEPNWQNSFWGINYPRLLRIKQKYDPDNLFICHHCVGSEIPQLKLNK
jgi:hypothetical protein